MLIGLDFLKCYLPKSENSLSYVWESLKGKISYCNIKRLMFSSGWRYHAEIVVSGAAPTRVSIGTSTMGIDPGVSTIMAVSEDACVLEELARMQSSMRKKSKRFHRVWIAPEESVTQISITKMELSIVPIVIHKILKNYVKMCLAVKIIGIEKACLY